MVDVATETPSLPSPTVIVNISNSNEGIEENADTSGPNSQSVGELASATTGEIPNGVSEVAGLVEQSAAETAEAGADGAVQSGNAEQSGGLSGPAEGESDAVEIARITAERDIIVETIRADAEPLSGNEASRVLEELAECRSSILALTQTVAELATMLTRPKASEELTEEVVPEEMTEHSETTVETNSTQEFTPVQTAEISTELSDVKEDVEQDLAKIKPRFIPI